jgi:hypothetical protein
MRSKNIEIFYYFNHIMIEKTFILFSIDFKIVIVKPYGVKTQSNSKQNFLFFSLKIVLTLNNILRIYKYFAFYLK